MRRVVCIDHTPPRSLNDAPDLELGAVYTIVAEGPAVRRATGEVGWGFWLLEAPFSAPEHAWSARRFEAVDER